MDFDDFLGEARDDVLDERTSLEVAEPPVRVALVDGVFSVTADMVMKSRAHHDWKYRAAVPVICGSSVVPLAGVASPVGGLGV